MTENEQPGIEPNPGEPTSAEGIGEQAIDALKEGVLGKVAGMLPEGALDKAAEMLDRDGDGNPLNDLQGLMGRFGGNG
jgi:hypothetical protein